MIMMMKVVVFFKSLGRFYLDDLWRGGVCGFREFCLDVDLKHIWREGASEEVLKK